VQLWMPAVLALFGTVIVVVLTAWLTTRAVSAQLEASRAEMKQAMAELELRLSKQMAELELHLGKQIMELAQRVERLEEARGLVRPSG
jgi:uncharacterized membrane-anchored protein YhcB (DUF1043 family)